MLLGILLFIGGLYDLGYFFFGGGAAEQPPYTIFVFGIAPVMLGGWIIFRTLTGHSDRRYRR